MRSGRIELNDTAPGSVNMIPGDVLIASGAPGYSMRLGESDQIADTAKVTLEGVGLIPTTFELNGFDETIGSLVLTNTAYVDTGVGTLTVGGNIVGSSVDTVTDSSSISGNLALGAATRTIEVIDDFGNVDGRLIISANISGAAGAGIIKTGPGTLFLFGTNSTYSGVTTISNGLVSAGGGGLAATAGVDLRGGDLNIASTVLGRPLTNNSSASMLSSSAGTNIWSGDIVLNADLDVFVTTGFTPPASFRTGLLEVISVISGPGGITMTGPGRLRYSGGAGNTYQGDTTVKVGTLEFNKLGSVANITTGTLTIGDGVGGAGADVVRYFDGQLFIGVDIVVNDSGLLDLNNQDDDVSSVTLHGGQVSTGTGTLTPTSVTANSTNSSAASMAGNISLAGLTRTFTVNSGSVFPDLAVTARITNGSLAKAGGGWMRLSGANAFDGALTVNEGVVELRHALAAGTTNGGVVVNNAALLQLSGNISVAGESLTLNSSAASGALNTSSDMLTWTGPITLQSDAIIGVNLQGGGGSLTLSGPISGPGALTKTLGGQLTFSGSTTNTYTNVTMVNEGRLSLAKDIVDAAMQGPLVVGDGLGAADADIVSYDNSINQLPSATSITVNSSGLLSFNGRNDGVGALSGNGHVDFGVGGNPGFNADNGTSTFAGTMTGAGGFRKLGMGTLTLSGTNTYTGPTFASAGELTVNGLQQQSAVSVGSVGTLGGSGTVGNITNISGGAVAPGSSPGILTCSNAIFSGAASELRIELNGFSAGSGHDQLSVRGTNQLGGTTLNVTLGNGYFPVVGSLFTILSNDGAEPMAGTFAGLPQGALLPVGALKFQISYAGGTGNDVTLVLTNPPLTGLAAAISGGNGDTNIDANECNNLYLSITNGSGGSLSGITATLSTATPHVIISQPFSRYPDLAANRRGTNATPFQISTLPSLPCGSSIDLNLAFTSSGGNFVTYFSVPTANICGPGTGTGFCDSCPGVITNAITASDLTNSIRLARNFGPRPTCATAAICPGTFSDGNPVPYDVHTFTNSGPDACYSVYLDNSCGTLFAAAYRDSFDSGDLCKNYLADTGNNGEFLSFSFMVPAGSPFEIVVNTIPAFGPGCAYTLVVASDYCPPSLAIHSLPANQVRLDWPTSAGGFLLEATPSLAPSNWTSVAQSPVASDRRFSVTNNATGTNRFYRLRKPD